MRQRADSCTLSPWAEMTSTAVPHKKNAEVSDIDAASKSGKVARAKRRTVNVPSHIEIYENRSIDHILVTFYSIKKS